MLKGNCNSPENGYAMMYDYEQQFIRKIELAKDLPIYSKLEQSAQDALYAHTGCGLTALRANAFINRLSSMTDDEFLSWATALSA